MDNNAITLVISGYHGDLGWVSELRIGAPQIKNVILYAKSGHNLSNLSTVDKVVYVENNGINMYDICHYISNNYEHLSGKFLFLKSNSFSRIPPHCNFDNVVKICNELPNICPLEIEHPTKLPQSTKTINGGFLELNNNWLSRTKLSRKYFNEFDDYMNFFFKNYKHQNYLRFPPGGNIFVDSSLISKHPKYLYESLLRTVSHHKYPIEMMYLERGLLYILLGGLSARSQEHINVLPKVKVSKVNAMRWRIYSRLLVIAESIRPKILCNKGLD
ncbi:hypothetical protein G6733_01790 [Polynucleobacter paneuropaeus]|nr:hypothetical protein G6733_01790 [Polynucleobacter paneuropaeus]